MPHENRLQLAALYTLHHGLTRNTEFCCGYDHGHVLWWRLLHDARPQFIIDANLPRRTRRDLLAGNETIRQPAMNAAGIHTEYVRCFADRNQLPIWRRRRWLVPRDTTIPPQAANLVGREAFAGGRLAPLTIEDSSDHFIRVKHSQAPQQRDRVFVRARAHRLELWNGDIQCGECTAVPAQSQVGAAFGSLEIQNHFLQQCAQEFFAIAVGGGRRTPHLTNIGAESLNRLKLFGTDGAGALLLASP
jgi:hypothetical protein